MHVSDLMHKGAKHCSNRSNLEEVAGLMWSDDTGIVPIVDDEEKLMGVITDRDIAMAAALKHRPLWEISATELIGGQQCHSCHQDDDIHKVLQAMSQSKIRRMPVVDPNGRPVGMLSMKDIVDHARSGQTATKKGDGVTSDELLDTLRLISKPNALQQVA